MLYKILEIRLTPALEMFLKSVTTGSHVPSCGPLWCDREAVVDGGYAQTKLKTTDKMNSACKLECLLTKTFEECGWKGFFSGDSSGKLARGKQVKSSQKLGVFLVTPNAGFSKTLAFEFRQDLDGLNTCLHWDRNASTHAE